MSYTSAAAGSTAAEGTAAGTTTVAVESTTAAAATTPAPAAATGSSYAALRNAARAKAEAAAQAAAAKSREMQDHAQEASANAQRAYAEHQAAAEASESGDALQSSRPALGAVARSAAARAEALHAQGSAVAERNAAAMRATAAQAETAAIEMAQKAERHAAQVAASAADIARQQFEARWQVVQQQEQALALEAAKLEKYERQLLALTKNDQPNFPPKCCCVEPIVYHDILAEVSAERQAFVRSAYSNYYVTIVLLIYNFAIALTMMFLQNQPGFSGATDLTPHMGVSIILLFGIILAFVLWYWPTYKACSTGSAGQHIMARIGLIIAFLFNVVMTLGPVGYGGCGILYAMYINQAKGSNAFYPVMVNILLWGFQSVYFFWMLYRMWCVYGKEDKASLARAQTDLALGGAFRM